MARLAGPHAGSGHDVRRGAAAPRPGSRAAQSPGVGGDPLRRPGAHVDAVLVREGGELSFERVPDPVPGWGEVVIELRAAALNHRDLHVRTGFYQDLLY